MSRNYANIVTAIWRNAEFRALNALEQHAYLLLATQANISAVGVLPLTVGRWAGCAADLTPEAMRASLATLQMRRFIVFDPTTEELLVRSFVRWDGGYSNRKRRPVIMRAAEEVESDLIRRAIMAEFRRLGLPVDSLCDGLSDAGSPAAQALVDNDETPVEIPAAGHLDETSPDLFSQEDSLSDAVSASDGVVVTQGLVVGPTTHNPQPSAPSVRPAPEPTRTQRSKAITDAYAAAEPMSKWPAINAIVIKAIKTGRWVDDEIREALLRLAAEGRPVTVDTLRVELDGLPPGRASPRRDLVERDGLRLKPETVERLNGRARMEALDAAGANPLTIGASGESRRSA